MSRANLALDTSVAVPLLMEAHPDHGTVAAWLRGRTLALTSHSSAETYSILTRLPGDARLAPADAADLLGRRFVEVVTLPDAVQRELSLTLSAAGVTGGAVYDALVALAALAAQIPLATRDRRARPTYEALGVRIVSAP